MRRLTDMEQALKEVKARYYYRLYLDSLDDWNLDGGPGSGNWGHAGRMGLRGGSMPGGGVGHRMGSSEKGFTSKAKRAAGAREYGKIIKALDAAREGMKQTEEEARKRRADCDQAESAVRQAKKLFDWNKSTVEKTQETIDRYGKGRTLKQVKADFEELTDRFYELGKERNNYRLSQEEHQKVLEEYKKVNAERAETNILKSAMLRIETETRNRDEAEKDLATKQAELDTAKTRLDETNKALAGQYDGLAAKRDRAILKKCQSAEDCETTQEAMDYLRARNLFKERDSLYERDRMMSLDGVDTECATGVVKHVEKLIEDYPALKGKFDGIQTESCKGTPQESSYAYASRATGMVVLNTDYYGDSVKMNERFQKSVDSEYHPMVDYHSVIDHEFAHQIENILNAQGNGKTRVSDEVMKATVKRMNSGKYVKSDEIKIRNGVSGYAAENQGITVKNGKQYENKAYGRNTEFLAEAFSAYQNGADDILAIRWAGEEFDRIIRERIS